MGMSYDDLLALIQKNSQTSQQQTGTDSDGNPLYSTSYNLNPDALANIYSTLGVQQLQSAGLAAIDPGRAASDPRGTEAALIRSQWEDFVNTAVPVRDQLMAMTTYAGNPGVAASLKESGAKNVENAFNATTGAAQRQQQRYGMSVSPQEQETVDRAATLGKTAALVDVDNRANQFQQDLNRQVVAGASTVSGGRAYTG